MKKMLLPVLIFLCVTSAAIAQKKNDTPKQADVERILPGTWVVKNREALPRKYENRKEFLLDTLVFGPISTRMFENGDADEVPKVFEYSEETGMLTIIAIEEMDGADYELARLSDKTLVFWVPNKQGGEFIELVYTKIE